MVLTGQVDAAQKELDEKKNKGVLDVDDPNVRKTLGIPLDGFDMDTRAFKNSKPAAASTKKDRINQHITKD